MHVLPPYVRIFVLGSLANLFLSLRVVHTSSKIKGQIYIPAVNWICKQTTSLISPLPERHASNDRDDYRGWDIPELHQPEQRIRVRLFSLASTILANFYSSFSVATVMFSTTILISVQMKFVKHLHVLVALSFFLVFGFLDGKPGHVFSPKAWLKGPRAVLGRCAQENTRRRIRTAHYWRYPVSHLDHSR